MTNGKLFFSSIMLMVVLSLAANLSAMPPHPGKLLEEVRKGTLPDLVKRINSMRAIGINAGKRSFPVTGIGRVLVLLIDFSDVQMDPGISTPTFYDQLFEGGDSTTLTWQKYYQDMSNGELTLTFDVHKCSVPASYTLSYYGANTGPGNWDIFPATLVGEAIDIAETDGIDFSLYDNDNDLVCDAVMIIHAGQGEEYYGAPSDAIWSHRWDLDSAQYYGDGTGSRMYDGVTINDYAIQPEYLSSTGDSTIGVFVHEFGHILGLADLYDTNYNSDGVGGWSLMAFGSWNGPSHLGSVPAPLLAWERDLFSWVTVDEESRICLKNTSPMEYPAFIILSVFFLGSGGIAFIFRKKRNFRGLILFLIIALITPGILIAVNNCKVKEPEPENEIVLADIETGHKAVKISSGYSYTGSYSTSGGEQYYLCENKVRTPGTWTEYLPGEGLLITLIDNYIIYLISFDDGVTKGTYALNSINSCYSGENTPWCHGVTIIEADGDDALWTLDDDYGSATDPFYTGNKSYVVPERNNYTADLSGTKVSTNSGVYIYDISIPGSTMTFKF